MKIRSVKCVVVHGFRRKVFGRDSVTALGKGDVSKHAIVFVETDAGITGIGEIASCFTRRGALLAAEVDEALTPHLVGEDPRDISRLVGLMDAALYGSEPAKAGVEMALWDILGKDLGAPVYKLLGGKVRDRIPLSHSITFGTPEEMAELARERVSEGFRTVKAKVGQSHARDVAAVKAIREAIGPDKRLRVDANMAWKSAKDAISVIRAMEPYNPEMIEQPVEAHALEMMAEIRKAVGTPILADESVWAPRDTAEVIRHGAADVVNVYVAESGGISKARRTFEMCESFGLGCLIGSMPEFGIGTAAQIHLGIAMPNLGYDSDTCGVLYHEGDLLTSPLKIEGGYAYAPESPGLGVDVDMKALQRWAVSG
jgi:muconate cycloisomerase